jgi:hypothetical protein
VAPFDGRLRPGGSPGHEEHKRRAYAVVAGAKEVASSVHYDQQNYASAWELNIMHGLLRS